MRETFTYNCDVIDMFEVSTKIGTTAKGGLLVEIKLKDKVLPRNAKGDVAFDRLAGEPVGEDDAGTRPFVLEVFTNAEVVELVNRALYQIEYQKASHRKRAQVMREVAKQLKEGEKK